MAEYCTATQVENRLKTTGYLNVADDDDDGVLSSDELAAYITTSIAWAGRKIDYYVSNRTPPYVPSVLRSSQNGWCGDRCVDLAAWYAASNGGRDVPESLQAAYDEAIEELKGVKEDADTIPDAEIDTPYNPSDHGPFEILSGATT